jgi:hypothetical protein
MREIWLVEKRLNALYNMQSTLSSFKLGILHRIKGRSG